LVGLWAFYLVRAEHQTARELVEQGLSLAQNTHNPIFLVWAHVMLGETLFFLGEFALAREHVEEGIALYDPQKRRSYRALDDPKVSCLSQTVRVLWCLGYPDQALQRIHAALTLAQELSHPYSLAYALDFAATLHQFQREGQAAQELAEALLALSIEQGFALFLAEGTIARGWALVEQGQGEEGITQIRQGMAACQAIGSELGRPTYLAQLAEAYGKGGQVEEGLTVLTEALALVDKTGERNYEAELYRLKGQLTLQQFQVSSSRFQAQEKQKSKACPESSRRGKGQKSKITNPQSPTPNPQAEAEAEACFHKAIEVARRQQAKSWELRATVSLARLWQNQGKRKEAHKLLAEVYGWFTEGFDTKDLQEARALLEELSRSARKHNALT
ncbi:MAG TPA: hypothetical protein VKK81_13880, partial [Candidatus Binatia bacterium]|nr:hypothetical protein [Candidatus Binatia bacterium]